MNKGSLSTEHALPLIKQMFEEWRKDKGLEVLAYRDAVNEVEFFFDYLDEIMSAKPNEAMAIINNFSWTEYISSKDEKIIKSALLRAEAVEKELAERIKDYNNCVYDFTKTNELKNRVVHAQKNWVLTSGMVKLIEFILNGELFAKEVNKR